MEGMEFRIIDTLRQNLGKPLSIRALAALVQQLHGSGPYPNVRAGALELAERGYITMTPAGRSHIITLDVPASRGLLSETDLRRFEALLQDFPRFRERAHFLQDRLAEHELAGLLIEPRRGIKVNYLHLLVHGSRCLQALPALQEWSERHDTPIDIIPLTTAELSTLSRDSAWNRIPDWIRQGIAFQDPQRTWQALGSTQWSEPESPPSLDEIHAASAAWGYRDLGSAASKRSIGIEEVVAGLVESKDPRARNAAAVLLNKNPVCAGLLLGLAQRNGTASEIHSILAALDDHPARAVFHAAGIPLSKLNPSTIREALMHHG